MGVRFRVGVRVRVRVRVRVGVRVRVTATLLHDGDHAAEQQCEYDDQRV